MARTIIMAFRYKEGLYQDLPDYWQLDFSVTPKGSASKTDVMLVQALLVTWALSEVPRANDKMEAMKILNSQPGRFDDGIYGPRTRALLRIFENQFSPYKDGIVRPTDAFELQKFTNGIDTHRPKLVWLNAIWDLSMTSGPTKKDQARLAFNPILFSKLYDRDPRV
jgi:hypothetical protein